MMIKNLPKASFKVSKIALGGALLMGLSAVTTVHAKDQPLKTVDKVELDRYLGVWYEVARKPLSFQNKCDRNVTATYTLNENGNVTVDNKCLMKDGKTTQSLGEAYIQNAPFNTKLKVSFLPGAVRWLPIGRGDYWILKIDEDYQTVLVGEPERKYMWVLSRTQQPSAEVLKEYLDYAKSVGYDLGDIINTKQTTE